MRTTKGTGLARLTLGAKYAQEGQNAKAAHKRVMKKLRNMLETFYSTRHPENKLEATNKIAERAAHWHEQVHYRHPPSALH